MDENTNKPEKTQGPVCAFCYKWCPRMLMLVGILVVIGNLYFVCVQVPQDMIAPSYSRDPSGRPYYTLFIDTLDFLTASGHNITLVVSVVTTLLVLFTLLLKLLRARI